MVHPGFRLVEPKSLQLAERGDMGDYVYQRCLGFRFQQPVVARQFSNILFNEVEKHILADLMKQPRYQCINISIPLIVAFGDSLENTQKQDPDHQCDQHDTCDPGNLYLPS